MNPGCGDENQASSPRHVNPNAPYKFSPEEMRVVKECNKESFFQRCLPLGSALGVAAYYGVNAGYLKPSAKFGAAPKVAVAVIVGYFVGKFSYQSKCAEKLMQLPNSRIGEMLRQRRKGFMQESLEPGFGPGMSLAPFSDVKPTDQYSDLNPNNNIDIDTTRPQFDGLDDNHRPSMDNPIYDEEMPPVQKNATTYEELRRKNREEFQQRRTGNFREPLQPLPTFGRETNTPPSSSNKYGDSME